ncbi:hypothetical protein ABBQ38_003132 [Trebouxia sp. C0009 RCD-2024]
MATAPDGIPASPKTVTLDANKLNSLPTDKQSNAKLETSIDVVVVPKDFLPKQGRKLSVGYTVGKAIGAGLQAGVYELLRDDGTVDKVRVLKAKHRYALMTKMQREWEVGRRISSLKNPEQAMPGFMSVGAAVCTDKGSFKGMILERLDGKDTAKLIEKPSFHDIHYVREMLFSVFCALDVSQKQLGFHHSDLRLANIMDIGPEPPNVGAGPSKARGQQPLTFPLSTAAPKGEGPGPAATAVTSPETSMIPDGQAPQPDQEPSLPGQTEVQSSGAHMPAHQVHASPFQQLSKDRRKSWDEPRPDRPVVRDSAGNEQAPGANRQFSLELTTYASIPVRNTKSGFRPPHRYKVIDYGLADFEARYAAGMIGAAADQGTQSAPKEETHRQRKQREREAERNPGSTARRTLALSKNVIPSVSILERTWRYAWRRKGDVYHLLFDMCRYVDGRVWPTSDKTDVLLFLSLMHHVTGTPLRAWFADISGEHQDDQVLAFQERCLPCGCFERNNGPCHFVRTFGVRLRGWFQPRNPGLTAAEVLTSPFFKPCYDQHWAEGVRNFPSQLDEIQE